MPPPVETINLTHAAIAVGITSTLALPAEPDSLYRLFQNDSDAPIYLACGVDAQLNFGIRLDPNGGSYEMSPRRGNLYLGDVYAIHGSVQEKRLLVTEGM